MADHGEGEGGGGGDVIDQPEDRGSTMEAEMGDQTTAGAVTDASAAATDGGDGGGDHEEAVRDEVVPRAIEDEPRARVETSPVRDEMEQQGVGTVEVDGDDGVSPSQEVSGTEDRRGQRLCLARRWRPVQWALLLVHWTRAWPWRARWFLAVARTVPEAVAPKEIA